jgi:universal stress protein A
VDIQPRKILWPTDFSELSLKGGQCARALCAHFAAELHVIHVIAPVITPDFSVLLPLNVPVATPDPSMMENCRASLTQLVTDHFGGDPQVITAALFGNPWSSICEYARQQQVDLIVVTTHGRTGLEHVVIGSTAERIVQHAPCAVLTIKNAATDAQPMKI